MGAALDIAGRLHAALALDPRGLSTNIRRVFVDPAGGPTVLTFECGHAAEHNQTFAYRVGDPARCRACRADHVERAAVDAKLALGRLDRESKD